MSIENITGKILAEAEEQSKKVLEEAADKSRTIIEKAEQRAAAIRETSAEKAKEDGHLAKSRRISVAELEVRKIRLGAKQELISHCFEIALEQLANMEEEEYIELLESSIIALDVDGGELVLNERDRKTIGNKLVKKINDAGKVGTLILAEDTVNAKGGFVLRRGSMEINSTLETMINSIREAATPDVVKALFD